MTRSYVRQLDTYPVGRRRVWLLAMAVVASLVGKHEAQIAPIVPALLTDLNMSLVTYGNISAIALVAGAIAGLLGGRLTDSLGRVRLLIPLMFCTAVLSFLAFDGISMLAEENTGGAGQIGRAMAAALGVAGLLFIAQTWLAALLVPNGPDLIANGFHGHGCLPAPQRSLPRCPGE